MRLLIRAGMAAATVAVLALSGCGLPSGTEPKYVSPAQSPAAAQGGQKTPPKPTDGLTSEQLVASFLSASVGANLASDAEPDANQEALIRMRGYMTPGAAANWKPTTTKGIVIVRDPQIKSVGIGNGRENVTLQLQPLGTLTNNGDVRAWAGSPAIEAFYQTVLVGGQRRFDDAPRDQVFISETGLRNWYAQQPVYFWSNDAADARLVPDLRYMPSTLSRAKQVAETVRWLRAGPGQLLGSTVAGVPDSIEFKDTPVIEDNDVKVNLSGKANSQGKDVLSRLARQLRWSLPDHQPVKLSIESQDSAGVDSEGYLNDNPAVEASQVDQTRYIVVNESVRSQIIDSGTPEDPLFVAGPDNTGVVAAALNRQGDRAALVRKSGTGSKAEQRLYVSADPPVANPPRYEATNIAGPRLSRPAWITYPSKRLMISDGTRLYVSKAANGRELDPVELGTLSQVPISAFAVAPEGRRIAFVSAGTLMVATLTVDDNGKFSIGAPTQVSTSLGDNQAVGWLTETTLAVGGKPNAKSTHPIAPNIAEPRYNLVAVTIDGAQEEPLPQSLTRPEAVSDVTELVCRVNRPGFPMDYPVLYEANGVAQRMFTSSSEAMWPQTGATPATPVPGNNPTSPFFAD
ncbi:LpqB family beta-propeller domain-containing protein [Dactylosporangium sp. CS-033363]|uniref:LpqB family beta-propeller domain-containing protein n=1 Tax=Dactylosporangium sp. CS-033363 TaxID=3239935 RepID=UPI003D8CE4E4